MKRTNTPKTIVAASGWGVPAPSSVPPNPLPDQHEQLLIDSRKASALLAMSQRKLWELTDIGAIPSLKVCRSVRYMPAELRAWVRLGCPVAPGSAERVREAAHQ